MTAVELDNGHSVPCDVIVVGVGIVPNVELAAEAGLVVKGIIENIWREVTEPLEVAMHCR